MNIPNLLTWGRVAAVPVLVAAFYWEGGGPRPVTAVIFALAALTDWLDGYLARRWEQSTRLGAFLDPVADKLMVVGVLVVLVQAHPTHWMAVPALLIISREVLVSALRECMASFGAGDRVAVAWMGKVKTTMQMLALLVLIYTVGMEGNFLIAGVALLWVAAGLTVWSAVGYARAAWPILSGTES